MKIKNTDKVMKIKNTDNEIKDNRGDTAINVTRASLPPFDEYCDEIRGLWESFWITNMGVKHEQFQRMLEEYLEVPHAELMVNGHMALEMTLQAMELHGEVITTPFTFVSTTHAIVRNGLTPVFCDINPDDYTIDAGSIEELITEKTSAIVPVHVYGNICDVDEIQKIADKYGLKIIYDAAHAFGEKYQGRGIGNYGDATCFSFHATKVFNSIEGGAVCFSDKSLSEKLYDLKNFGIHGADKVSGIGANAKMNEFCAAMGICNLRHVDEEMAWRKAVDERYRENLSGIEGITLNRIQQGVERSNSYFPVMFDKEKFGADRDEVSDQLASHNILARKYFYPLTNGCECYAGKFDPNSTPVAKKISRSVLTLPIYAGLESEDVDRICEIILKLRK